jgi:hypothetical protein
MIFCTKTTQGFAWVYFSEVQQAHHVPERTKYPFLQPIVKLCQPKKRADDVQIVPSVIKKGRVG